MFFERIFLASLIAGAWALIEVVEELLPDKAVSFLPKPFALYAIFIFVIAIIVQSSRFAIAQRRRGYFKTRFEREGGDLPELKHYPSIDIFVSVYNEEKVISKTIENLLNLEYPNYKLYLASDHSTDNTLAILSKYAKDFPEKVYAMDLSHREKRGKAAALNYMTTKTSGEIIAVFDADAKVEKDFLLKMVPYIVDEKVAAVQAPKKISNYKFNKLTKLQENEYAMDSYFQTGRDYIDGNVELRGNGLILDRKIFEGVGKWDETSLTEDLELSTRLVVNGWKIRFSKETEVYEQGPITFQSLLKQRLRWCEGSLRRVLSNMFKMFGPYKRPTFAQQFDSFVFLSQFAVPMWLFLDLLLQLFKYFTNGETHLTSLMLISLFVWFLTWFNATCGIRAYRKFSWATSAIRAFETNMYFMSLWPTVVILTMRKVLFSRTKGKWNKTEHYSDVELANIG